MGFLDHISHIEASQVHWNFLIVAPLSLIYQGYSEAATWAPDMVAIIYYESTYARDFLVEQYFFYTYHFMPKVSDSKLNRQHSTKVSTQKCYNDIFCRNCGILIISFSLAYYLLNNHKISSR